ncbi:DNA/RNA nuclease SfsA [Zooshikella harenae]|uniref:Sugar fermentation stimulation protein homolog n=1 Tax=Zooshikella harenae TaxID=2827238 RepID=A0ABS5Z5X3_9GAMM|nr:DNA/RNA nuclease SfsA [Zooshikella harenae]MBU2709448.1 DNA/RNA nuclease SfsA [Zooshikella harenae]
MKFEQPLKNGVLIKRYKRFLADISQPCGKKLTLHCPNTGSMLNCAKPESQVWFSWSDNPKRKYPGTWELVEVQAEPGESGQSKGLACINTGRANTVVYEGIQAGVIEPLSGYETIRKEVKYGSEKSRIDLLLESVGKPSCYVEVKSVTLAVGHGWGLFPDAVSARGTKHLRELSAMCAEGHRAVLVFCVQNTLIEQVAPADHIDSAYGKALREAVAAGVEVYAYGVNITLSSLVLDRQLPVYLSYDPELKALFDKA